MITIPQLIKLIGTNPAAIELLAARSHELSPAQRTAALKAACATDKAPKARDAVPTARSRMARLPLRGFHS